MRVARDGCQFVWEQHQRGQQRRGRLRPVLRSLYLNSREASARQIELNVKLT